MGVFWLSMGYFEYHIKGRVLIIIQYSLVFCRIHMNIIKILVGQDDEVSNVSPCSAKVIRKSIVMAASDRSLRPPVPIAIALDPIQECNYKKQDTVSAQ